MTYSKEQLEEIRINFLKVKDSVRLGNTLDALEIVGQTLSNEQAQKHVERGVRLRLMMINRCIQNIFSIFPPDRKENLSLLDELADVNINLHALFMYIAGVFDNIAWVFVYENNLKDVMNTNNIGLFKKKTQRKLPAELRDYLNSERISSWHREHLKIYRDSFTHRIPPYLPPYVIREDSENEFVALSDQISKVKSQGSYDFQEYQDLFSKRNNLGVPSLLVYNEEGPYIYFHFQVLVDYLTVEEIVGKFCECFVD